MLLAAAVGGKLFPSSVSSLCRRQRLVTCTWCHLRSSTHPSSTRCLLFCYGVANGMGQCHSNGCCARFALQPRRNCAAAAQGVQRQLRGCCCCGTTRGPAAAAVGGAGGQCIPCRAGADGQPSSAVCSAHSPAPQQQQHASARCPAAIAPHTCVHRQRPNRQVATTCCYLPERNGVCFRQLLTGIQAGVVHSQASSCA